MPTGIELENRTTFKIVTGDGKEWLPDKLQQGGASLNPNTAGYDKPNTEGSEVRRNSGSSPVFDLLFQMNAEYTAPFLESCKNPNKWRVTHSVYGAFDCLPISIDANTGAIEGHVWTVKVWQTIGEKYPIRDIDVKTDVKDKSEVTLDLALENVTELSVADKRAIYEFIDSLDRVYNSVMNNDIKAAIDDAQLTLIDASATVADVMKAVEKVILLPRDLTLQVKENIRLVEAQYNKSKNAIVESFNMCRTIESIANQTVALLAEIITNPKEDDSDSNYETDNILEDDEYNTLESDYRLREDVLAITEDAELLYQDIVSDVDSLVSLLKQDDNGSYFTPNPLLYENADLTISSAISGVNEIALSAKAETIYIAERDTTIEWLAWKLYGSASDSNVNLIIDANDLFGRNTLDNTWRNMIVNRGKNIIYYS